MADASLTAGWRNGYHTGVRRIPAILLLGLFSFSLIEPAALAEDASRLPACCRREGLHHCAMTNAQTGQTGPSARPVCAAFSRTGAAPACSKTLVAPSVWAVFAEVVTYRAASPRAEVFAPIFYSHAHHKRGPPIPSVATA